MKPSDAQRLKQRFQTPCFECEERYLGCHGKCEKYQTFTKERNSNKKVRDEIFASQMFYGDEKDIRNFRRSSWMRKIALSQKMRRKNEIS